MRRPGKKFTSDYAPRCNVCRKVLAPGLKNRCAEHPTRRNVGPRPTYEHFLALPIPEDGATHAEIAVVMGVTAERVRQIEVVALRKLFKIPLARKLFRGE